MLCHAVDAPGDDMPAMLALCAKCVAAVPLEPDHEVGSAQLKLVGADPCILAICICRCVQQGCVAPAGHGITAVLRTLPMCLQKACRAAALCSIVNTCALWFKDTSSSTTGSCISVVC